MRNKIVNIYILFLFTIVNLIHTDIVVMNLYLKTLVFTVSAVVAFALCFWFRDVKKIDWKKFEILDWAMLAIMLADIGRLIWQIRKDATNADQEFIVFSIVLMYFIMRQCNQIEERTIFLFSISNFVMYCVLMINRIYPTGFAGIREQINADGGINAWLVLGICIQVIAYCTAKTRRYQIWYGVCTILGAFLLFLEKNMIAILIVETIFIAISSHYQPTKGLIRRTMQMFFGFNFLLCNMSLITGYVEVFKGITTYDLEVSVYMELVLAVIGLIFFTLWDKCNRENTSDDELLPEMLPFFRGLKIAAIIYLAALFTAAVRGASVILPDMMLKLLSAFVLGTADQTGIFNTVGTRYGLVGAIITFVFLFMLASKSFAKDGDMPDLQKPLKMIVAIYVMQSILLKQTMMSVPLYAVLIIAYWNQNKKTIKQTKGEDTNEANYSDTVL